MILGALMLIRSPLTGMGVSPLTALSVTLPAAVIIVVLMRLVLRSRAWKQSTGREQMVGEIGEVTEAIEGRGMVRVHGELWSAVARQSVPLGAHVRVSQVQGLTLRVEPVNSSPEAQTPAPFVS
jgi:membrane-bound serine protease (ClpP class)